MTASRSFHACGRLLLVLSASVAFLASRALAQDEWQFELVDNGKHFEGMSEQSLVVDSEGQPHVAYGDDFLYYAWFDGTTWHHETADTTPLVGHYASISLDNRGYPHISYYDHERVRLKYAHKDENGWQSEIVTPNLGSGEYCSIEVDDRGHPHISYCDGTLRYAYWDGVVWHVQVADFCPTGPVGRFTSLELDGGGYPHISYYDHEHDDVKYTYMDSVGWHDEVVGPSGGVELGTSLELDAGGYPHIGYLGSYSLKYAYKDVAGWHIETIEGSPSDPSGAFPSLELDEGGNPRISYGGPGPSLRYAYKDGAGWNVEIAAVQTEGTCTSLALDSAECPHITCKHPLHLDYVQKDAEGWHRMWADDVGDSGRESWMALDEWGRPHIGYMALDDKEIRYATRNAQGWHVELVEAFPLESGKYPSLAVDSSGRPHLCYFANYDEAVRYAHKEGEGWEFEDVNPSWAIAGHLSLVLDPSGFPHLCYWEEIPASGLKYAYKDVSGWHIETATDAESFNTSSSLDSQGYPHISCFRTPQNDLNYVYKDREGWHLETVDSFEDVGSFTSLALDAQDNPHISYRDMTNNDLKYAYKDKSGWHFEIADDGGNGAGWYSSLVLDNAGYPHISYVAVADSDLRYAYRDEEGWHIETIFPYWCGGENHCITLALDGSERPHIAYYNDALTDLMYVYQPGPPQLTLSGEVQASMLILTWNPVLGVSEYWVYGDDGQPFFIPGMGPSYEYRLDVLDPTVATWASGNGVGDPSANWTYLVMAVDEVETELARSNRVGETDYLNEIP